RQRITINYNIEPLEENEIAEYVQFRLSVAGCDRKLFDDDALREVYHYSEGYPRLINIICDHALLTTFVQGAHTVTGEIVGECADELKIQSVTPKEASASAPAAPAYSPQPIFIQSPPSANTVSPIHRVDYWMYGIILVLLMFIAAYLVFSAPMRIARMIGLDTISVESNAGIPPATPRRPDPSSPSAGPIPQGQPPIDEKRALDLPSGSDRAGETEAQATDESTPTGIAEETLDESSSSGLVSAKPETGFPRVAADPPPGDGAVEAAIDIPTEPLKIYFQNNSNELTPEAYGIMEKTARILEEHPFVSVIIRGYTDSLGNLSYNVKISEFRANIVKTYLVGKGLSDGRAATFGMGPVNAIADNNTLEGRQLNRRVEIEFIQ
ncbi:MAG: OmpA family protein, partial [Desulfobacterales bacterium]